MDNTAVPKQVPRRNEVPPDVRASGGTVDSRYQLSCDPPPVYTKIVDYTRGNYHQLVEIEQVPPALVDSLTRIQALNEGELTYLLIADPYHVLKLAGDYLPEIGTRERAFWQTLKKQLPPNLDQEAALKFCLELAFKYGFKADFFRWQDRYMECFFTPGEYISLKERAKQLLREIVAAHNARESAQIVMKSTRFQQLGAYYE